MGRSSSPQADERHRRDRDRDRERRDRREKDSSKDDKLKEGKSRDHRDKESRRSSRKDDSVKEKDNVKDEPRRDSIKEERVKEKDNVKEEAVKTVAESSSEGVEQRIARIREARLNAKKKDEDDIAAWVSKSRALAKTKKKAAPKPACIAAEEDEEEQEEEGAYSSKDLAGLKIRHGLDHVMDGGEVILTLKDKRILEGDDLNEEADELENINIAEQKARREAYQAAKKSSGLNEDRFQNDINSVNTILPKYDDITKDEGLVLDEAGRVEDAKNKLEEVRKNLQAAMTMDSLNGPAAVAKDFYTEEEMMQFKKPKKKKKLRKKDVLDVDAIEAEAKAAGLNDLGSRDANRKPKQEEQEAAEKLRKEAYDSAFTKAQEASKALRMEPMDVELDLEEEDDLYKSLKKARQQALKNRPTTVLGPEGVAARLAEFPKSSEKRPMEIDGEKPVVITDTEEFCLSLQLDEVLSRRNAGRDAAEHDDHDQHDRPVEEKQAETTSVEGEGGWVEVPDADKNNASEAPEEDGHDDIVVEPPIKEVSVGKGLAGVLQLLHERGSLKDPVEWGGRNMDKKASKLIGIVDAEERDILLDRRDEYGRRMTPKESFRKLSHRFHGKEPGKIKQEKKMKQYEEELKQKRMSSDDTPGGATAKIRDVQAKMHTPYIVISGHIKPGQTSDPRSGFATVEKETVGSLTPMLGDKKVEHFLGIKRKADSSMGPPPPKRR